MLGKGTLRAAGRIKQTKTIQKTYKPLKLELPYDLAASLLSGHLD